MNSGGNFKCTFKSHLQLFKCESSTEPDLAVVFEGGAVHQGSQPATNGAGCDPARLLHAYFSSADLAGRLVEPRLHPSLPVLVEMPVRDHVVTFGCHLAWKRN